jgi:hypothetical protein
LFILRQTIRPVIEHPPMACVKASAELLNVNVANLSLAYLPR